MKATTKDVNVLRIAILPAFILSAVVVAIATLSVSISDAVTGGSGTRDRERAVIEKAVAGTELADNQPSLIR
jgi:hypothetical protein